MDQARLTSALSAVLPQNLATDLVSEFVLLRQDRATHTFGRAAPGKFVETLVQALQHLGAGKYDAHPDVEDFFQKRVENLTQIPDGLRICASRVARAMYALRSKRNIVHKGEVDPNTADLAFLHAGARWVLAEMLRHATGISMQVAGELVDLIHAPVGALVEEIDGRRIVHGDLGVREEILVLLHSRYPEHVPKDSLLEDMDRRKPGSISNRISELYAEKLIQGDRLKGYRLTIAGFNAAAAVVRTTLQGR